MPFGKYVVRGPRTLIVRPVSAAANRRCAPEPCASGPYPLADAAINGFFRRGTSGAIPD